MNPNDILLGRGRFFYRNPGNVAFRDMIRGQLDNYTFQANRSVKRVIIDSLIAKAKEQGSLFLVRCSNDGAWCEAHPKLVRSKVSHALRDARNSEKQKLSLKNSLRMSDSVKYNVKQSTKSKKSIPSSDRSIKKHLPPKCSRIEFPLEIKLTTLAGLQNEYGNNVDHYNFRPHNDMFQENEHLSMSKKNKESRTKVSVGNTIQHQFLEWKKDVNEVGIGPCDDQESVSVFSHLNDLSFYTPVTISHLCSALSSHDMLTYANSILDLSAILGSMDTKISMQHTTYTNKMDHQLLRKGEYQSIPIEIWCQGPPA